MFTNRQTDRDYKRTLLKTIIYSRYAGGTYLVGRDKLVTVIGHSLTLYDGCWLSITQQNPSCNYDKTCNKSCETCTSLAAFIGIVFIVRVQYYAGTCNLQPITAYRLIDGISRLLTERAPDWQAWDVAK